jgi:hypothetical protein
MLWCPKCGSFDNTPLPGGKGGFSQLEVLCDGCGHRFTFAVNVGAEIARQEEKLRRQGRSTQVETPDIAKPP